MTEPTMTLDMDALTLNEVEQLEEVTGTSIDKLMDDGNPKGKVLKALIWIVGLRENPELTLHEAGDIPLSEVMKMLTGDDSDSEGND